MIIFEVDQSTVKKNPFYGQHRYEEGLLDGDFTFTGAIDRFNELVYEAATVTAHTKNGIALTGVVTDADIDYVSGTAIYHARLIKGPSDSTTDGTTGDAVIINVGLVESASVSRQIFDLGIDRVEYFYEYLPATCPSCDATHSYYEWGRDYTDSGYPFATCPSCGEEEDYYCKEV